jgi:hypothetical protein
LLDWEDDEPPVGWLERPTPAGGCALTDTELQLLRKIATAVAGSVPGWHSATFANQDREIRLYGSGDVGVVTGHSTWTVVKGERPGQYNGGTQRFL